MATSSEDIVIIHRPTTGSKPPPHYLVIDFGKHAGTPVDELPKTYLSWLLTQKWIGPDIRRVAEQLLEVDQPETDENPSPELAAVVLPGIAFEWFRDMRYRFDGDRDANPVIGEGFELLKQLCSRFTGKE